MKATQILILMALAAPGVALAQMTPSEIMQMYINRFQALAGPGAVTISVQLDPDGTVVGAGVSNDQSSLIVNEVQVDTGDGRGVREYDTPIMINGMPGL